MKRIALIIVCLLMMTAFAACGIPEETPELQATQPPAQTTPEPIPTPTPEPEPQTQPAEVVASGIAVLYETLERGDEITVLGEEGNYYVVEHDEAEMYVEKWLARAEDEEIPVEWSGYSKKNTKIYSSAYLTGEEAAKLSVNTEVTVKDEFGDVVYVEWDDKSGYAEADMISNKKIKSGGGKKGSGSGGGSADGGDIVLGAGKNERSYKQMLSATPAQAVKSATVLSDGAEIYIDMPAMGDIVRVLEKGEETCTLYYDGLVGTVPVNCLKFEGDADYQTWVGYARKGAPLYEDYAMRLRKEKLDVNTEITIFADMGDFYFVKVGETAGYISKDKVSEEKIKSSGGKKGSGSNSAGGDWTDPVL